MGNDFVEHSGIFVPEGAISRTVKAQERQPLAFFQQIMNSLFYKMEEAPVDFIGTLGKADPLLPKAKAVQFQKERYSDSVHEIGPGNFHFARTFVDAAGIDGLVYNCHDFSDSSFNLMRQELAAYEGVINFNKTSLREFPAGVSDDPLQVILVEVLDDTLTEFFTMYQGDPCLLMVRPEMDADLRFPSKALAGKLKAADGDFSQAVQKLLSRGSERTYSASDIIGFMDSGQWQELENVFAGFLTNIKYKDKQYAPIDMREYIYRFHWRDLPKSFEKYGDAVLAFYIEQLKVTENSDRSDPMFASLPVEGLKFLWRLKDRKKVHIDFFDYGYDSIEKRLSAFSVHTGQITAPVNFEIMKYAAELLGFETTLEKDREYINRYLGVDTIRLGYVAESIRDQVPLGKLNEFALCLYSKAVKSLCPGVDCRVDNIRSFRMRRADSEAYIEAGKQTGDVNPDFQVKDGSYHFAVYK